MKALECELMCRTKDPKKPSNPDGGGGGPEQGNFVDWVGVTLGGRRRRGRVEVRQVLAAWWKERLKLAVVREGVYEEQCKGTERRVDCGDKASSKLAAPGSLKEEEEQAEVKEGSLETRPWPRSGQR